MKRLKATIPNGGAPLGKFPVLREIFDAETKDAIEAIINTLNADGIYGVVISGCVAAGTSPTVTLSAGYVLLNNKILRVAAQTGLSYPFYIEEAAASEESDVFADGGTKAFIDVEEAQIVTSGAGAQFIQYDQAGQGGITLSEILGQNNASNDVHIGRRIIALPTWNMQGVNSIAVTLPTDISGDKILSLSCRVEDDAGTSFRLLDGGTDVAATSYVGANGGVQIQNNTTVVFSRAVGGEFDSTDYNDTVSSRGVYLVEYELDRIK